MTELQTDYGWKIVAALFVILLFSSGLGFYNHAVILDALADEQGFPITIASTAVSVFFFASGIVGPPIASIIDRYDVRLVIAGGAVLAALSLGAIGYVETRVQLFAVYVAFGIGFCASGLLPATTLVTRWFTHNRAMALSVTSTGLSVGGIVVTPLSATLIESLGIRAASPWLGLAYFLGIVPLAVVVLRSSPQARAGLGDGGVSPDDQPTSGIAYADALRMTYFWTLGIAYTFVMTAQVGGIAHQYGIVGKFLEGNAAAWALGILPFFSIIGRLAGGVIIDRYSAWKFTVVMMILQALSLTMMALSPNAVVLGVGLAVFGVTVGNLLMLQPLLVAETFGLRHYARIFSINNLLTMCGVAAGPILMGFVLSLSGDYKSPYLVAAGAGFMALLVFIRRPPDIAEAG